MGRKKLKPYEKSKRPSFLFSPKSHKFFFIKSNQYSIKKSMLMDALTDLAAREHVAFRRSIRKQIENETNKQ